MKSLEKTKGLLHENGIKVTVMQITDKPIHYGIIALQRDVKKRLPAKNQALGEMICIHLNGFFQPPLFLRNNLILQVTETNFNLKWKLCKILEKEKYLTQYLEKC